MSKKGESVLMWQQKLRSGIINEIDIEITRKHNSDEITKIILEGFDLNCCQVAINLENGSVIYTPDFEEFLRTMQLKVTSLYTPFHSAIRLPKKQKELNCYCDVDTEMEYLSQVPLLYSERKTWLSPFVNDSRLYTEYFGDKYFTIYQTHRESIDKYFVLHKFDKLFKSVGSGRSQFYTFQPLLSREKKLGNCFSTNQVKIKREILYGKNTAVNKNLRLLNYSGKKEPVIDVRHFALVNSSFAQCDWHESLVRLFFVLRRISRI